MQYPFSNMVAIPDIQRMLDTFESSSGVPAEIKDVDGQIIVASLSRNMWHEFHPDILLSRQSNEKSSWRDEPIRGFFQYARTIRVEDWEIGTLFLGPVFHTQPDEEIIRQLAQEFDFDQTTELEKVKRVPIVTEEQAQGYVEFLVQLIQGMAKMGLNQKRLIESLTASQGREAKLQSAFDELETRILERTEELQKANEALQEGEQRFRVALIDTPIVVFNQDLDLRYT